MPVMNAGTIVAAESGELSGYVIAVQSGGGAFTYGAEGESIPETANDGHTPNPRRTLWRFELNVPGYAELAVEGEDLAQFFDTYEEAIEAAEAHGARLDRLRAAVEAAAKG